LKNLFACCLYLLLALVQSLLTLFYKALSSLNFSQKFPQVRFRGTLVLFLLLSLFRGRFGLFRVRGSITFPLFLFLGIRGSITLDRFLGLLELPLGRF